MRRRWRWRIEPWGDESVISGETWTRHEAARQVLVFAAFAPRVFHHPNGDPEILPRPRITIERNK